MPGGGSVPEDQVTSVGPQVQPTANLTPDAPMSSPVGDAAERAGDVFQKEQYWANHAAAIDAQNQFQSLDNDKLYHPQTGLLNQNLGSPDETGKASEQTLTDYRQKMSEINAGLSNDAQRAMFQRMASEHLNTVQRQVYGYENQQYKRWDGENVTAAVKNSQVAAVNTYTLPDEPGQGSALQHQVDKQESLIVDYGRRNGLPQTAIDLQLSQSKSATYAGVADDALSKGNTGYVTKLLSEHGDDILPEQRDRLRKALETTDTNNQAQQIANGYLAPDKDGTKPTYADAVAKLTSDPALKDNADLYDRVAGRVDRYYSMQREATHVQQSGVMDQIQKGLAKNPNADPQALVSPSQWQTMDGEQQLAAQRLGAALARRDGPQANSPRYIELMAAVGTPAFKDWDPNKDVDKVAPAQMSELIGMWSKLQDPTGKSDPKIEDALSDTDILNGKLRSIGVDPRETANTDVDTANKIYQFKLKWAIAKKMAMDANGGKPLTAEDKDALSSKLLVHQYTQEPSSWYQMGATQQVDKGELFMQTPDAVKTELTRGFRAPALTSKVSAEEMQGWTKTLANPKGPAYQVNIQKLGRWKQGLDDQGNFNPALKLRYQAIRATLGAAVAPAGPTR